MVTTSERTHTSNYQLLKLPRVLDLRGKGRTQHFDDIKAGVWTKPVKRSYRDEPPRDLRRLLRLRMEP
jgi:hypothetical protein